MTGSSFYSVEKDADGRSGGTTQAETRVYNERLVISLIRRHGQLSKVELTRLTGLSPQTITTMVNRIADNGLLVRLTPLRGRLGQPSVPYALNAEGAYSLGLKIDRRSADVAMINFLGEIVAFERTTFDFPVPADVMAFARAGIARICRKHKAVVSRIAGLGIASPFHIGTWNEETEIPAGVRTAWQQIDIRAELDREFDWPVYLFNDAMIAAGAELMFGAGVGRADFLYIYVGSAVGGGLVLDHHLFPGRSKLAGMLGDIPVPVSGNGDQTQLLKRVVSLKALAAGLSSDDAEAIWASPDKWGNLGATLATWVEKTSEGLVYAILSVVAVLDVDNVIIDGAIPAEVRRNIARAVRRRVSAALASRPEPFSILEGNYGHMAPAIGGASIPLLVKYSNDKDLLFKD